MSIGKFPKDNLQEPTLPNAAAASVDLLLIAGEHSGDQHAAKIVNQLLSQNPNLNICALGGPELQKTKAQFLYDLTDSSVVGLVEVLKNYPFFKRLFDSVLKWIRVYNPKRICFVDYPGFNLRIAKALYGDGLARKAGGGIELYYYIAPQVWAWKSGRRFKMAKYLDSLGVIFPFEVEVFSDTTLNTQFVGHPFVDSTYEIPLQYEEGGGLLLLPGSRKQAVSRIYPILLQSFKELLQLDSDAKAKVVYPDSQIREILIDIQRQILPEGIRKKIEFCEPGEIVSASAVLTSSGTMSLKCALAGIPGAIVYRAHPLTYWVGKRLVKIPYLGIANILLNRNFYPEFIQNQADPAILAKWVVDCQNKYPDFKNGAMELSEMLKHTKGLSASEWLSQPLE